MIFCTICFTLFDEIDHDFSDKDKITKFTKTSHRQKNTPHQVGTILLMIVKNVPHIVRNIDIAIKKGIHELSFSIRQ